MKINSIEKTFEADTVTPVGIYLALRDVFPGTLLLESSEHGSSINSRSIICADPLAEFKANKTSVSVREGTVCREMKIALEKVPASLEAFFNSFDISGDHHGNGIYGFTGYNAIRYFETIDLKSVDGELSHVPDLQYSLYRYIIVIDHYHETLRIICNFTYDEDGDSLLNTFSSLIHKTSNIRFPFSSTSLNSNISDDEFISIVEQGKAHCRRGDVFQVVLSRRFSCSYTGDDMNVYRSLRTINPSPYLFYYDMGSFRLFGSSPESQVTVKNGSAEIHPIAGTARKPEDPAMLKKIVSELESDPKENAEHVMLVDLARNDLSKCCTDVKVAVYKQIQMFSHVMHMVSKVSGNVKKDISSVSLLAGSFPAGTLSGAPKFKAMEIIDALEESSRKSYGGAVGYFDFNGDTNHAIIIRSFLSTNGKLYMQAGAGVVHSSKAESELQEVENKLGALSKALKKANSLTHSHENIIAG